MIKILIFIYFKYIFNLNKEGSILKGKLTIKKEWCKGCNICVEFCPKNVLELKDEKISIKNLEACIQCNMCGKMCPDFAVSIKAD